MMLPALGPARPHTRAPGRRERRKERAACQMLRVDGVPPNIGVESGARCGYEDPAVSMRLSGPRGIPWLSLLPVALLAVLGCQPSIGDQCTLSTDCSTQGDRLCDTSQPNGYCTIFNCAGDSCPGDAVCVQINAAIPGCAYDDRHSPSRSSRTLCLASCASDGDCRAGYACVDPGAPEYGARVLADRATRVCMVRASSAASVPDASTAPVCGPSGPAVPDIDAASPAQPDASAGDAGDAGDAGAGDAGDAGADASSDASSDAALD